VAELVQQTEGATLLAQAPPAIQRAEVAALVLLEILGMPTHTTPVVARAVRAVSG